MIEKEDIIYNTSVIIFFKNCKFNLNTRIYYELLNQHGNAKIIEEKKNCQKN